MNSPSHVPLLGLLLCKYLTCGDLYRLALCSREWYTLLFEDHSEEIDNEKRARSTIWSILIRRDFCIEREGGIKKYAKLTRQAWHWRLGRTRPPIVLNRRRRSGRYHRLLVNPEEDEDAESCLCVEIRSIDSTIQAYCANGTPIALHQNEIVDESKARQGRVILDAVLTTNSYAKHERLSVLCSGLGGACWVDTYSWGGADSFSRVYLEGTENDQTYVVRQHGNNIFAAECMSTIAKEPSVLVWDWNRPELPKTVLHDEASEARVIGLAVADDHTFIRTLSNGAVCVRDLRERSSTTLHTRLAEVKADCYLSENLQLVLASKDSCALIDLRFSNRELVSVWGESKVGTLAKVARHIVVAGASDGWAGPLTSLNVAEGTGKRLQYSGEKSYHVCHLSANRSMLAASCTDWHRLFVVA